jgi:GNAT superfamily N-acetyltransferase
MRRRDAPAIVSLVRALNRHQGDPTRHFTQRRLQRDGFGRRRQFDGLLAELGGRPVGYVFYVAAYETGWTGGGLYLQDLYVRAECRASGVGSALLAAVAAEAKRRGKTYLWCGAKLWNRMAHRFYRATASEEETIKAFSWVGRDFADLARFGRRRRRRSGA